MADDPKKSQFALPPSEPQPPPQQQGGGYTPAYTAGGALDQNDPGNIARYFELMGGGGGGGRNQLAQLMPQQPMQQPQQPTPQMGGGLTAYGSPEYAEWERQMTQQQQIMQAFRENPYLYQQWLTGSGPGNSGVAGPGGAPSGGGGFSGGYSPGNPSQGPNPGNPSQGPNPGNPNGVFGDPASISTQGQVESAIGMNQAMSNLGVNAPGFFGVQAPNVQNNFNPTVNDPYGITNPMNMENPFDYGFTNVNPAVMNSMNMMGYMGYDSSGNGLGGNVGGGIGAGDGVGGGYGFGIGPGPGGENSVGPDGQAGPY